MKHGLLGKNANNMWDIYIILLPNKSWGHWFHCLPVIYICFSSFLLPSRGCWSFIDKKDKWRLKFEAIYLQKWIILFSYYSYSLNVLSWSILPMSEIVDFLRKKSEIVVLIINLSPFFFFLGGAQLIMTAL